MTIERIAPNATAGAVFSDCEKYRYVLWRDFRCLTINEPEIDCAFIGLNPSTATHEIDDPTIRRCKRFAQDWGCNRYVMLNAYGLRSTDPKGLWKVSDPIGPDNDWALGYFTKNAKVIVAAWGTHCDGVRAKAVCEAVGRRMECLGRNADGSPKHPLYLPKSAERVLFWAPIPQPGEETTK